MTTKQLFSVGAVLLGILVVANVLANSIWYSYHYIDRLLSEGSTKILLATYGSQFFNIILYGVLPAAWLIAKRKNYAERLFGDERETGTIELKAGSFAAVGIVLISLYMGVAPALTPHAALFGRKGITLLGRDTTLR